MTSKQMKTLAEDSKRGAENAIPARRLADMWCMDARAVRQVIHDMRLSGMFIVANQAGYYFAETDDELLEFVRKMDAHARDEMRAIHRMRVALKMKGIPVR